MKLLATDLDGTLLNSDYQISEKNVIGLNILKTHNYKIVLVTGRNLYSALKVVPQNLPVDYIIFSTGLGVFDFNLKKIVFYNYLDKNTTKEIIHLLDKLGKNYFVHFKPPHNHYGFYKKFDDNNDFDKRINYYSNFCLPLTGLYTNFESSQFIIFINNEKEFEYYFKIIQDFFPKLSIVKASSPFSNFSLWLEIYPPDVNKGKGLQLLCNQLNIDLEHVIAVGNDYNDLDMLTLCPESYLVANAPEKLKSSFKILSDHNNHPIFELALNLIKPNFILS